MLRRQTLTYWDSILVSLGILYLSLIKEMPTHMDCVRFQDKWGHMSAYFVLGFLLAGDVIRNRRQIVGYSESDKLKHRTRQQMLIVGTIAIIYGGVIEILQSIFFYPRTGDIYDWLADIIGTLFGIAIGTLIWKRNPHH